MSLTPEARRRVLECGALAPSGDNLQPWHVDWRGDTLRLSVDATRDRSLYNFQHRASLIALGAMIENVSIASREFGHLAAVSLRPAGERLLSAEVTFSSVAADSDALFPFVARRVTNRKPYGTTALGADVLDSLRRAAERTVTLHVVEDASRRRAIATAASLNDRLLFENRLLHDRFFESIRWTPSEAEASRDGLFVGTLELGAMSWGFRQMRSWNKARLVGTIGASRFAPGHSLRTFMRSAAFGFVQAPNTSPEAFVEGGRALQRIWLTATRHGLAFQPMAGMLYLVSYLRSEAGVLRGSDRRLVERARDLFTQELPLDEQKGSIMIFRVGYGPAPSATSLRRPLTAS